MKAIGDRFGVSHATVGQWLFGKPVVLPRHGWVARVTPVPIPNTEVTPRWADDTARVSVWEIG